MFFDEMTLKKMTFIEVVEEKLTEKLFIFDEFLFD